MHQLVNLLEIDGFIQIYNKGGYAPQLIIVSISTFLLALFRFLFGFENSDPLLVGIFLVAMAVHTIKYEAGNKKAPIDLALTLFAIIYFGWAGSYFISIMKLSGGQWWLLLTIIIRSGVKINMK